jgi:predicted dehydrogenase
MRFGVIGLGSMGKRRVRDLLSLGHEVVGFDLCHDRGTQARQLFSIPTESTLEVLLRTKPDALIISTPPDQHVAYYEHSFKAGLPFFTEANILTPRVEWFGEREHGTGVRGYPSATWRFYPLCKMLRQHLQKIGLDQVNSVHHHYGGYLPFWHPWERYEDFYGGRSRQTCAAREMVPFEMEWLCWIFGPVKAVCAARDRQADWTTDIDDAYLMILEFASGLRGTLHVELHQVAPFRVGRIACRRSSFILDMAAHELRHYDLETDTWDSMKAPSVRDQGPFDFEQVYLAEIKAFVDAIETESKYPKTWAEHRHLSNVLIAAEESWRRRTWVDVAEAESLYDGLQFS